MKKKKSQPVQRKRGLKFRQVIDANWPLFKIYLLFGLVLLVLFTIIMVKPVYYGIVMPFNKFLAHSSASVIILLGGDDIICSGTSVSTSGFAIDIAEGCNGIYALSIVIAGIIAFPAPWRPKSVGLLLSIILIMILNYIRILTLWYVGKAGSFLFDVMHLYVWEFVIIVLGAGFWYFWYEKFVKARADSN